MDHDSYVAMLEADLEQKEDILEIFIIYILKLYDAGKIEDRNTIEICNKLFTPLELDPWK